MNFARSLLSRADQLVKNTGWMLASEVVSKISRVATVIALAAFLSPADYGVAALALMIHELFRVFTRAGSGALVIQCSETVLERTAVAAWVQQWLLCIVMIVIQFLLAPVVADYYEKPAIAPLLQITAISYLLYPIVSVRVFLLQRKNAFRHIAFGSTLSISADNLSTVLFLMLDASIYAVAYAKIVAALVWFLAFIGHKNSLSIKSFHWHTFANLALFSVKVFSADLLKLLRFQLDILIAGKLLPPELFGLYSFAKNAGIGLSQSLSNAYLNGLTPFLAEKFRQNEAKSAIRSAMKTSFWLCAIFLAQAVAAPIYLKLLFSSQWDGATLLVSLLCLSAIPTIFLDTQGTIFRLQNRPTLEVILMAACVLLHLAILCAILPSSPLEMATTVLISSFSWLVFMFTIYFIRTSKNPNSTLEVKQ